MAFAGQPAQFFPKADAGFLSLSPEQHALPNRPKVIGPVLDSDTVDLPIDPWCERVENAVYPPKKDLYAPATVPDQPTCPTLRYPRAHLAKNERLRLSMLWYYTRDIETETGFLSGLQEKACLAQEATGWEYVVIGILDVNVYIRLAAVGLELGILPRGETLCAHTVTQPPGSVFLLPNMMEDWRFRESPYCEKGGLKAYAGVPLRMQHESGESVGLGTICVASPTSQDPLPKSQQQTLARLADWIVADIIQCARARRQRERHRMAELLATAQRETEDTASEEPVLKILRAAYPGQSISLQSTKGNHIEAEGQGLILPSDLEDGLWEDTAYIDEFIASSNHKPPPVEKVVRFISARCESRLGTSLLIVATKDFRRIFDDIDSWFLQACATLLTQRWQTRLLSEVTKVKETFLRGVSHQLRTPIHGILGAAELLAEDLKAFMSPESDLAKSELIALKELLANLGKSSIYLDTISTAGRELMSTVNSMITLNRWADIAVADRQYAVHSVSDIEKELTKGISEVRSDTRSQPSIFFHYDLPRDCGGLWLDLNLLRDSLLPLIINAIQNASGGTITVTVSINKDSKALVIDVEDNGCGIAIDDQQRIFGLYEKVGEHSTGAGLGLALATKFSALLHGSIDLVSSDVGVGSHFRATFKDVDYVSSPDPTKTMASKLENLPAEFHNLTSSLPRTPLAANLIKFMTQNGFSSSDSVEGSLLVLDYVPEMRLGQTYVSKVPLEQVAICLVPSSEREETLQAFPNIVYVEGPFSTTKLSNALEKADGLLANLPSPRQSVPQADEPPPVSATEASIVQSHVASQGLDDDACSNSDEGYGSMNASPALGANPSQTSLNDCDTDSNIAAPSICQHDANEDAKKPISPLSTVSDTAKPVALLVDDNNVNLRILQMYCKKRGLQYHSATDGQEAVKIYSEQQSLSATGKAGAIELVLMDLQMPVCDGIEATQQIRLLEKTNGWKPSVLLIVTGQDSQSDREAASGAGADDYLVKPVGVKVLDSGVKRYFPALNIG